MWKILVKFKVRGITELQNPSNFLEGGHGGRDDSEGWDPSQAIAPLASLFLMIEDDTKDDTLKLFCKICFYEIVKHVRKHS